MTKVGVRQVLTSMLNDYSRSELPECLTDASFVMGVLYLQFAIGFGIILNVGFKPFYVISLIALVGFATALLGMGVGFIMRLIKILKDTYTDLGF